MDGRTNGSRGLGLMFAFVPGKGSIGQHYRYPRALPCQPRRVVFLETGARWPPQGGYPYLHGRTRQDRLTHHPPDGRTGRLTTSISVSLSLSLSLCLCVRIPEGSGTWNSARTRHPRTDARRADIFYTTHTRSTSDPSTILLCLLRNLLLQSTHTRTLEFSQRYAVQYFCSL